MQHPEKNQHIFLEDVRDSSHETETVHALVSGGVNYMEQAMPRFLQDLQMLCLTESPSDDTHGLNAMADLLAALLQQVGMQTSIVEHPRGNAVVGTITGNTPTAPVCLLLGHHDTVHPIGVAQSRVHLDGNAFYGPGTVDMKAGLLQGIYALEVLNQQAYRNFHKILFVSVPDEEISTRYHVGLLKQIAQEHPFVLGLEGARSIGNVVTRRKGCMQYRLTAKGVAAHAGSNPEKGHNAVVELAHQIIQAQQLMGWRDGLTINAGPITGGSRANIVSDFAEIIFDLRFLRTADRLDAESHWRELLHNQLVPGVKLTLRPEPDWMQPMEATEKSLGMAHQVKLIAEHILKTPFDPETRGGASDCCTTASEGCPSIDGLGALGGGAHTDGEYVLLSPIASRVALLAGLLASLTTSTHTNHFLSAS